MKATHFLILILLFSPLVAVCTETPGNTPEQENMLSRLKEQWDAADGWVRLRMAVAPVIAVIGAGAIWKLITAKESNRNLYMRAKDVHARCMANFGSDSRFDRPDIADLQSEEELVLLVDSPIIKNFDYIDTQFNTVKKLREEMYRRIYNDQASYKETAIFDLKEFLPLIDGMLHKLERLSNFWKNNKHYFKAHHIIQSIARNYEQARINSADSNLFKEIVLLEKPLRKNPYPFTAYARQLEKDRYLVEDTIIQIKQYPILYASALALNQELGRLLVTIVQFPEYAYEKGHKLEKERLKAEMEKAQAMMQHALAEQAKANAMQQIAMQNNQTQSVLQAPAYPAFKP